MADTLKTNIQTSNFKPYNLNIKHPTNILLIFSFFSPFIVIFFFTFMGMYFSPLTGIIFLVTIIITIFMRMLLYNNFPSLSDNELTCNLINYSGVGSGDIYLSLWVFSFTLFYILVPLISNNGIQTSLMTFLVLFVVLFVGDIAIKFGNNCYSKGKKFVNIFLNILFGICIGGILGLFISLGYSMVDTLKPHLFFSKKSSNETCKQVNDTKFQCSFDFE